MVSSANCRTSTLRRMSTPLPSSSSTCATRHVPSPMRVMVWSARSLEYTAVSTDVGSSSTTISRWIVMSDGARVPAKMRAWNGCIDS